MKVLTAAQMREVDRRATAEGGIPSLTLMEQAGQRVVELLQGLHSDLITKNVVILCGKGNNGGDGLVVARLVRVLGGEPKVILTAPTDTIQGDAAVNLERWRNCGGEVQVVTSMAEWETAKAVLSCAHVVVDALLGTGLNSPLDGFLRRVVEDINLSRDRYDVVAVDIPSGVSADGTFSGPSVQADYTVTFAAPKRGQLLSPNSQSVGRLLVRSIGTPEQILDQVPGTGLFWVEPDEFRGLPFRRRPDSHKGDFGHALLIAGSRGKTGAAILAAQGALRAGVGLVTVATPDTVLPVVAAGMPEMMTEPLASTEAGTIAVSNLDYGRLASLAAKKDVLAIGPGLSAHLETQQFARAVVSECPLPIILDADGLNAFGDRVSEFRKRKGPMLAITPHPGELARLLGCGTGEIQSRRHEVALKAAREWNAYVVLKGRHTVIATPDGRAYFNPTGNPGMASGGTGDVLTGMLAGLTAQFGTGPWEKVLCLGVYLHGLAGDLAAAEFGEISLVASDVVRAIPAAVRSLLSDLRPCSAKN